MIVIESPNEVYSLENRYNIRMFLAGGITNCPDWQSEMIQKLKEAGSPGVTVYNPRRKNFEMNSKTEEEQITWEFEKLRDSQLLVFWFSSGSLNPITLYELGMWGNSRNIPIVIGIDPNYERKTDVIIQSKLAGYKGTFSETIQELSDRVVTFLYNHQR
jgi:lipopolysaccharide biosynthesis glycosyltransferase